MIGTGTAGLVTAAGAAGLGAKVALIRRSLMGGDCLNVGCVPSKGLISAARAAAAVRNAGKFGVHVAGDVQVDFGCSCGACDGCGRGSAPMIPLDDFETLVSMFTLERPVYQL